MSLFDKKHNRQALRLRGPLREEFELVPELLQLVHVLALALVLGQAGLVRLPGVPVLQ